MDEFNMAASKTVAPKQQDHYATITNAILAALEQGVKPWAKPWETKGGATMLDSGLPFNAASGRNYRGLNIPMLWAVAAERGHTSHAWVSHRQAEALGGNVRKGEKATYVYFFKFLEKQERQKDGSDKQTRIPLIRCSAVFNICQTEGCRLPQRAQPRPTESNGALGVVGPVVDRLWLVGGLHLLETRHSIRLVRTRSRDADRGSIQEP